jgi:hypothetical protein
LDLTSLKIVTFTDASLGNLNEGEGRVIIRITTNKENVVPFSGRRRRYDELLAPP